MPAPIYLVQHVIEGCRGCGRVPLRTSSSSSANSIHDVQYQLQRCEPLFRLQYPAHAAPESFDTLFEILCQLHSGIAVRTGRGCKSCMQSRLPPSWMVMFLVFAGLRRNRSSKGQLGDASNHVQEGLQIISKGRRGSRLDSVSVLSMDREAGARERGSPCDDQFGRNHMTAFGYMLAL
jgi:hypothetical protein